MHESIIFYVLSLLLALPAGQSGQPDTPEESTHPAFAYDLDKPNAIFEMPDELVEISGLSMVSDNQHIAAVNDEDGKIFVIDKLSSEVVKKIDFWDGGDYEGIEIVGDDAWVIKSSGTMYHVKDFLSEKPVTNKLKSFLNKENDVEGLAYDPLKHCLYVGCKGKVAEEGGTAFQKAIYEFDLTGMMMKSQWAYQLTLPDIQDYLKHLDTHNNLDKLLEDFDGDQDELKFSPSGIAIHPNTCEVYVTSSKGKMLLVLSPEGKILHLIALKKKIHAQPEGICFDLEGILYIANEGKDGKAKVYKFMSRQ